MPFMFDGSPVPAGAPNRNFVILDRDGTINFGPDDLGLGHHILRPEDFHLIPGVAGALRLLHEIGFGLVVVTNQSAIGRGTLPAETLAEIHFKMERELAHGGVRLDGIFVCPHTPDDGCSCRKPKRGLIDQAVALLHFDPGHSFVIGDNDTDILLGKAVGATTVLVLTGHGKEYEGAKLADYTAVDLRKAAKMIALQVAQKARHH